MGNKRTGEAIRKLAKIGGELMENVLLRGCESRGSASKADIELCKVVFCRVRTNHTRGMVFTPGITLQRTSVSSEGHSYPYPELREVLYDIHTVPESSGSSVRPWPQYPGNGYSMSRTRSEFL